MSWDMNHPAFVIPFPYYPTYRPQNDYIQKDIARICVVDLMLIRDK